MADVTQILSQIEAGDPSAAEQLLPLVYDELRKLAAAKMAQEKPGQTLQATALVHEAYLRLVEGSASDGWDSRGHFFAAAAESMRRILVDSVRRKSAEKHGGGMQRVELADSHLLASATVSDVLELNEAVDALANDDSEAAELVKLRFFAGFSIEESAQVLGISRATAYRNWTYARARLKTLWDVGRSSEKFEEI